MQVLRLPPRIKVLEALGALADGRVRLEGGGLAKVVSSEGDRVYTVYVDPDRGVAYSDDNGTRFRGYIGYPIISVLMATGRLEVDSELAEKLRGVPWRRLNETMKSYRRVEEYLKKMLKAKGVDPARVDAYVEKVMRQLSTLKLRKLNEPPAQP